MRKLLLLLLSIIFFISCKKEDKTSSSIVDWNQSELKVSVSESKLVLTSEDATKKALTVSWVIKDLDKSLSPTYVIKFINGSKKILRSSKHSPVEITTEKLNELLINLGVEVGVRTNIQVEVVASLESFPKKISGTTMLNVTTYGKINLKTDWGITGDVINNWGKAEGKEDIPFKKVESKEHYYTAEVYIRQDGEIKFRKNNSWTNNYGDDGTDGTLDKEGANIPISKGKYRIIWNLSNDTYSLERLDKKNVEGVNSAFYLDLSSIDNGNRVMMQAFYWDVKPLGQWWDVITTKLNDWKVNGVNRIWLPPATKGQAGAYSMGYDPSDYFDFGEYNQHGAVETRFGSRSELEDLIKQAHDNNIEVIADIVLGHNSGGGKQYNPFRKKYTYTLFDETNGNASGKFNRNAYHFHPNDFHNHDKEAGFYPEQDLCHHKEYVQDWLWKKEESVAKYYRNTMNFDGWRFDYVKSFEPWVVKEWVKSVGGFAVGEYWEGNSQKLNEWVEASGVSAFDFACFYAMEKAFDSHGNLNILKNDGMLRKINPDKAVTFVSNHDTEKEENSNNKIGRSKKLLAYAYILTHSGYPTIFYSDYENPQWKEKIQKLLLINRSLATGDQKIFYVSRNKYIDFRLGDDNSPGLLLYLNNGNSPATKMIKTHWKNKKIVDYTMQNNSVYQTDVDGYVSITIPANSYSIWSLARQ